MGMPQARKRNTKKSDTPPVAPAAGTAAAPPVAMRAEPAAPPAFLFQPVRTQALNELTGNAGALAKVTSIVAPIGYGKTVLLTQLHAHQLALGRRCHWVGLDERAETASLVVQAIELALHGGRQDTLPTGTQALLHGQGSQAGRLDDLLATLSRQETPVALFIDNLNSCSDSALNAVLNALVFDTPPPVTLYWTSTERPAIDWGRAKLENRVRELRLSDLCLNKDEVTELLGEELQQHIGHQGVDAVYRQTEGWPAAVRLAQIALTGSAQPRKLLDTFSGSDEDIAALLNRKVLQTFSRELRDFLFCLAQLRTFSVPLCRAMLPEAEVEAFIDLLIQRNIFVIPLDRNRQRYRLHSVFREYLLSEAERHLTPSRRQDVLRRAAAWCEGDADWRDAIDYAVKADDLTAAGRILERSATVFHRDYGDIPRYIEWAQRLEAQGIALGWETHYLYTWALVYRRRFELARIQMEKLGARVQEARGKRNAPPADLPLRIDLLQICIDLFSDRMADAERGTSAWLVKAGDQDPFSRAAVLCIKTCYLATEYQFKAARIAMATAEPIMRELSGAYSVGWVGLIYGLLAIHEGKYADALPALLEERERIGDALGRDAGLYGNVSLAAALCAVEIGEDGQARELVRSGLQTAHSHGLVDTIACGLEAATKLWDGGETAGDITATDLRKIAASYPPRLSLMLACYLIRRLIRLGRLRDAQAEAKRIGLLAGSKGEGPSAEIMAMTNFHDLWLATSIELLLATHDLAKAQVAIESALVAAKKSGRIARQIELGLDKAMLAHHAGNRKLALKEITLAVIRATPQGMLRPFLDRSTLVADLIGGLTSTSPMFSLPKERQFFDRLRARLAEAVPSNQTPDTLNGDGLPATAPTARELELLRLIERGLSNEEIAAYANASLNTIKWHLKNLYRKLGVNNRAGAITRARAMDLLG